MSRHMEAQIAKSRTLRATILRMVLAAGLDGIAAAEIGKVVNRSGETMGEYLRQLAADGLIEKTAIGGTGCRWGAPGIRAKADAAQAECKAEESRRREAWLKRREAYAEKLAARQVRVTNDEWSEQAPIRRLVNATQAKPLRVRAPSSVWQLGAMG